eukprot:TRINITY_DN877_c0_g1_i1.p1 TRINITY_DN877_c0_g1~~TRINITY_DN877_c0_g1_i1.p1  ORF type:complete len:329 (-),score=135.14 TRINITY_DN877_c0_g1_i1:165-1151(-)
MMIARVLFLSLLCALALADGPMGQWESHYGSVPDGASSQLTDITQPVPGQALIVQSKASHIHELQLTNVVEGKSTVIESTSVVRTEDGSTYATVVVQTCDIADAGTMAVNVVCMEEDTKSTFKECAAPVPFNFTVSVLYFTEDWGVLPESGENYFLGFPYSSNAGQEHNLFFSFTTPKNVDKYSSLSVTASPLFQFDDQVTLTSAGNDFTLLAISTKNGKECPNEPSGDVAKVSGTSSLSVTTAEFSSGVKANTEYFVYFEGGVEASLYAITVSLLPAQEPASGGGGGGTSAGWVTFIAFACFFFGMAVVAAAGALFVFLRKRQYDQI